MSETKADEGTWLLAERLPDGHRLFTYSLVSDVEPMWAIADDSGDTPPDTDDGTLWLDFKRYLLIARQDEPPREFASIPLLNGPNHRQTSTPSNMWTLLKLATRFNWRIAVDAPPARGVVPLYRVIEL
jgi:hypothetical protein